MADAYAADVMRRVLAHILQGKNFDKAEPMAFEHLVDITGKMIQSIGVFAKEQAELTGRTEINMLDVLKALDYTKLTNFPEVLQTIKDKDKDNATSPFDTKPMRPISKACVELPSSSGMSRAFHHEKIATLNKGENLEPSKYHLDRVDEVPAFAPPLPNDYTFGTTQEEARIKLVRNDVRGDLKEPLAGIIEATDESFIKAERADAAKRQRME